MVIVAKLIGIVLLSLVATQVFMIMFLGSLERFTIWLYTRHPTTMARLRGLLKLPSQNTTKQRSKGRQDSKYEAWSIECFEKVYQWIHACERGISSLIRKTNINANGDCQNKTYPNEHPDTVKVGFLHLGYIGDRTDPIFSRSHIRTIVNKLRRSVNQ
jgi:hypothetical protein